MRRKRKGKKIVILVILTLLTASVLLLRFLFVIRNAEVEGIDKASTNSIVRSAGIGFGESIFHIDDERIARAIDSTGRYGFDEIQVRYPDTLILYVHERIPAAMASYAGQILVLDADGAVIEFTNQLPDSDIMYIGNFGITDFDIGQTVSADPKTLESYRSVAQAIQINHAQAYVSELFLSDPNALTLVTRRGIKVELGDASNMMKKIAWMKSAVADLEARGTTSGTLDVASGTKADYMPLPAEYSE